MNLRDYPSVTGRRKALEQETKTTLRHIGTYSLDDTLASSKNCENMIGVAQIPLGVAGPLRVNEQACFVPLATTEGALVASVNRGCKAIEASGGAVVTSFKAGATRGPVFKTTGAKDNVKLTEFLYSHINQLNAVAQETSGHITLTGLVAKSVGRYVFVRFSFDTQNAMGMNMVTIATEAIAQHVKKHTGVEYIAIAGNYDIDKKPAWLNVLHNRGYAVWAEVVLPGAVVGDVLKTTPKSLYDVWVSKCMIGSAMAGSMGFNAHMANVIAAFFAATGQDLGHVGECSCGITVAERIEHDDNEEDLYMSIYLPDVMVGTVGGGTGLATQQEALSLLDNAGDNKRLSSEKLAHIIGGVVLAGEISLLASLSQKTLGKAHKTLARGGK